MISTQAAQQASSKPSTPVHVQHSSLIPYFRRIAMRRKSAKTKKDKKNMSQTIHQRK